MSEQNDFEKNELVDKGHNEKKLEAIAIDVSSVRPGATVLREIARLQLDNSNLIKQNYKIWSIVIGLVLLIAFLFSVFIFIFPKYKYLNTRDNASICTIDVDSSLAIADADIIDFAKSAVINSYSYDYVNYREKINNAANEFYSLDGRKAYFSQLDSSGNLERVLKGRLIQRAMASQVPQLEERDLSLNWWVVQVPVQIEFYSGSESKPRTTLNYKASVRLIRVPPSKGRKLPIAVDSTIFDTRD